MPDRFLLSIVGVLCGGLFATQAGVNAQLARFLGGQPVLASAVSFTVGTGALLATVALSGLSLPSGAVARQTPLYEWVGGGLLGAAYLFGNVYLAPRLGAAWLAAVTVAGQLLTAVLFDNFGLLGFQQHALSSGRALGCGLLTAGAVLIASF